MPNITNKDCHKDGSGSNYIASCDVAAGQGETLTWVFVIIYPASNPSQTNMCSLGDQGNGHYASSAVFPPMGSSGPYKAKFRVQYSANYDSAEIDVT